MGDDHPFEDLDTNTIILTGKCFGQKLGNLTAYGLLVDLNNAPVFALSSQVLGIRFDGTYTLSGGGITALCEAKFASQSDYKDSLLDYTRNIIIFQQA